MALPVVKVDPPSSLQGQNNGRLTLGVLRQTSGLDGGPTVTLVETASRAWRALSGAAQADGIILQTTSAADSYRPLAVQKAIFAQRYTPIPHEGWNTKTCNGVTYWQRPGTATAACPGTSNHGYGLAVDVADASGKRLDWLLAHAKAYGWSWELQSEPWHLHYFAGDNIPQAVLDFETEDPLAGITDKDAQALIWRVYTILHNLPNVPDGPTKGEKNELHDALARSIGGEDLAAVTNAAADGAKAGSIAGVKVSLDGATVLSEIASTVTSAIKPADI